MKLSSLGLKSYTYTELGFTSLSIVNSYHVVLKLSLHSLALPCPATSWLTLWNSDHRILKSRIFSSALPRVATDWLDFWNSDHVVLKSFIHSLASPLGWQSDWPAGPMTMMKLWSVMECRLALPYPRLQRWQRDSECIFVNLEIYLKTLFC